MQKGKIADRPRIREILDIRVENPKVKTFIVEDRIIANQSKPGQFVMLWIPGVDEIPISVSKVEDDTVWLTVAKVGEGTARLHSMSIGDKIGVRGPYGRPFYLNYESLILVGGGYGVAPLAYAAEVAKADGAKVFTIIGAKTRGELVFVERLKNTSDGLYVSTDDGSYGFKGFATQLLENLLSKGEVKGEAILTCGPEVMMYKVFKIGEKLGLPVQASMERFMMCGIGICGTCALGEYRVCIDGPVFDTAMLRRVKEWLKQ